MRPAVAPPSAASEPVRADEPAARTEPGILRVLRNLDLGLLVIALGIFLAAGLPMLGYAVGAGAWLLQRGIRALITRRAAASDDPRTLVGLLAASMIGRGWLVAGAIFAVGLSNEDAGLSAAILFLALFTLSFTMNLAVPTAKPQRAPR